MDRQNMFFEKFQNLLNVQKEKEIQKTKRGDNFNIFSVLNITTREVKHSAFIAELLNPNGTHGLGVKPLKSFLSKIGIEEISDDSLQEAHVTTEHSIGSISDDRSTGGSIDILLHVNDFLVVIENKINAEDQQTQMFRYHNFCKSTKCSNHRLLYLTLDRHSPGKDSLNGLVEGKDYECISYEYEIISWLRDCICYASAFPLIRETLQQYLKTVLTLTNQEMDKEQENRFYELMADYPEVVTKITDTQWSYRQYLVKEYVIKPLKDWCSDKGFRWYEDKEFFNQSKYVKFGVYLPNWRKMIVVEFEGSDFRKPSYGVWKWESDDNSRGQLLGIESNESWPYGWEHFDKYQNWDASISKDLKDGKVFRYVKDKFEALIKKLEDNKEQYPMN